MSPFTQLAIAILSASALGLFARWLRQPLILAYILAGLLLGPMGLRVFTDRSLLETLSTLGIALLLFLIGMDLDVKRLRMISVPAFVIGAGQFFIGLLFTFVAVTAFGLPLIPALYTALALTFSSTIIIVKLLGEKQDLDSWYARLTIGINLIDDIIAIVALLFLAAFSSGSLAPIALTAGVTWFLFKGVLLFAAMLLSAQVILRPLFARFARTQELLFLGSIGWCLLGALLAELGGFSISIGAFFAGLALAQIPYHLDISSRLRPLRDFFLTLFFVALGAQIIIGQEILSLATPIVALSLLILVGNPLITLVLMGILGFRKRISFFVAVTTGQVGEFAFMLMAMGQGLGHTSPKETLVVTAVALITIPLSTYCMLHTETLYRWFARPLQFFERKKMSIDLRHLPNATWENHVVLFGYHRMGTIIAQTLERLRIQTLIVDFNPDIIARLIAEKRASVYGDMSDRELLAELQPEHARMIISTVPDYDENRALIQTMREANRRLPVYVTALNTEDALALYADGADYVIFPHALSAFHFSTLLRNGARDRKLFTVERKKHIETLQGMTKKELPY